MSGDHTKREFTVTRVEFAVPSGAHIKDFGLVEEWAWQDYCRRNGKDPKGYRSDDWCTVVAGDGEVVFTFTVETKVGAEAQRAADDLAECVAERDAFQRQTEKQGATLGRVRALLTRSATQDPAQEWIQAVRDAIEGRS